MAAAASFAASAQITPPPPSSAETVPEQIAEAALTCQFFLDIEVPVSVVIVTHFSDDSTVVLNLTCEQVMDRNARHVADGIVPPLPTVPAPTELTAIIEAESARCSPDIIRPVAVESLFGMTLYEVCQ
jgi:hypothetical protein